LIAFPEQSDGVGGTTDASAYWVILPNPLAVPDAPAVSGIALAVSRPNPATSAATIDRPSRVELAIYDLAGRRVHLLMNRPLTAGRHSVPWNLGADGGERVTAGVYWRRLVVGSTARTTPLVVIP
jgi:hypothetical protein